MSLGKAKAAAGTAALGCTVAAVAAVGGWPLALVLAAVMLVAGAVGLLLLRARAPRRAPSPSPRATELQPRRQDGPWSAYDRRRSATGDPSRASLDPQPTE